MQVIKADTYSVFFADGYGYEALTNFISEKKYSKLFILVDENTNEHCLPVFFPNLALEIPFEIIEIESGEAMKNSTTCVELWSVLTELGCDRKSCLINLGGGVVTDIGGFVASTFKRGIDFINIPTTLLAMVDASIGGKTGIDLGNLKNQIGTFCNPSFLLIDSSFLGTLPQREMRSGLAEMLKHGLIANKSYWENFLDLSKVDFADFDQLIHQSINIKNTIVAEDPKENGLRKALNFGHTLGHAIESFYLNSESELLHGEAVAVGMVLESFLSYKLNLLSEKELAEITNTIFSIFGKITFAENDSAEIMKLLIHDKKNAYGKLQFSLLNNIGNTKINVEVTDDLIKESFDYYNRYKI